jgi:hypothetical protein
MTFLRSSFASLWQRERYFAAQAVNIPAHVLRL